MRPQVPGLNAMTYFPKQLTAGLLVLFLLATLTLAGCGKGVPPSGDSKTTKTGTMDAVLSAWGQGDKAGAVSRFLEIDWSARPLFSSSSALGLSEAQFQKIPAGERESKSAEFTAHAGMLKQLASEVVQAARDATAAKDSAKAKKCLASLKQFGAALQEPACATLVQLVGKAVQKMADAEGDKLGL